jgi:hypothetical protein
MKKAYRHLLTFGWIVLVTLLGLELAVRVWGYARHNLCDPIYRPSGHPAEIAYVHKPNLVQARARGLAIINTDSLGLRSITAGARYGPKSPREYRIALIGDSVTFGEGVVRTEDTFAQVLEDTLNRRQSAVQARVFNFGASAYSVREMAATLKYRTPRIEPDLAVLAIIPSDFHLARTPTIDSSGYLIDQQLSRYSAPVAGARDVIRKIHLSYVLKDLAARWFFPTRLLSQKLEPDVVPSSYRYILDFRQEAASRHVSSVVVLLPRQIPGLWGTLTEQLTRDQVTHLDLSALGYAFKPEEFRASQFDPHPSAAVHRRIGAELANYVLSRLKATPP